MGGKLAEALALSAPVAFAEGVDGVDLAEEEAARAVKAGGVTLDEEGLFAVEFAFFKAAQEHKCGVVG